MGVFYFCENEIADCTYCAQHDEHFAFVGVTDIPHSSLSVPRRNTNIQRCVKIVKNGVAYSFILDFRAGFPTVNICLFILNVSIVHFVKSVILFPLTIRTFYASCRTRLSYEKPVRFFFYLHDIYSSHSIIRNSGDRAKNLIHRSFRFTECSNNRGKTNNSN